MPAAPRHVGRVYAWCLISVVNIMAVREGNATFIKIATAGVLFTLAMLLKEKANYKFRA